MIFHHTFELMENFLLEKMIIAGVLQGSIFGQLKTMRLLVQVFIYFAKGFDDIFSFEDIVMNYSESEKILV